MTRKNFSARRRDRTHWRAPRSQETPSFTALRSEISLMSLALNVLWGRALDLQLTVEQERLMGPIVLTILEAHTLGVLMTKGELGTEIATTNTRTVANYLSILEKAGYIKEQKSPRDAREKLIIPSKEFIDRATNVVNEWRDMRNAPIFTYDPLPQTLADAKSQAQRSELLERAQEAIETASETLAACPYSAPALLDRIEAHMLKEDWAAAEKDLDLVENLTPGYLETQVLRDMLGRYMPEPSPELQTSKKHRHTAAPADGKQPPAPKKKPPP